MSELPAYKLTELEQAYNDAIRSTGLPFRAFHVGSRYSRQRRLEWLRKYLLRNGRELGYRGPMEPDRLDWDSLYGQMEHTLICAIGEMSRAKPKDVEAALYGSATGRIGIWKLLDPPTAIIRFSGIKEQLQKDLPRRQAKAIALKRLERHFHRFLDMAVLKLNADEIKSLEPAVEKAMDDLAGDVHQISVDRNLAKIWARVPEGLFDPDRVNDVFKQ